MTSVVAKRDSDNATLASFAYALDAAGRRGARLLNDLTYDAAGNLPTQLGDWAPRAQNTWDRAGRMIQTKVDGTTTTYGYNARGIRVSQTVGGATTKYLIDETEAFDQVLEEYAPGGVLAATYIRGLDLLFQDRGGTRSFAVKDGLGSVRALTNASATVTDAFVYNAHGEETARTGSTVLPYRFAGETRDATGNYYLRARYYNPSAGRFTSRDRYDGQLADPITQNHYLYANADPINHTDPSGRESLSGMISAIGGALQLTAVRAQVASMAYLEAHPTVAYFVAMAANGMNLYSYATDPAAAMALGPAAMAEDISAFVMAAHQAGNNAFAVFRGIDMLGRGTGVMGKITTSMLNHPRGTDAAINPIGWDALVAMTMDDPTQRARGHIWAKLFGGPGADFRNIIPLFRSANSQMERIELMIRDVLRNGQAEAVYYRVRPLYDEAFETALPIAIEVEAIAVDALDNILRTVSKVRIING